MVTRSICITVRIRSPSAWCRDIVHKAEEEGGDPDLKLSEIDEGWDTSAQTKQKIRTVKKVNGKVCWVIQRRDRSKGQKERSKDGKGKIA